MAPDGVKWKRRRRGLVGGAPVACHVYRMRILYTRTNIVIDDRLMQDAMRATGLATKKETVELALRTLLRLQRQKEIRKLRGKLDWRGDLDAMRKDV